jgi:hypothetical protein
MAQPIIIRPDYLNAMVKGLNTNLAYMAESKKGSGGGILMGGGGGEKSKPQEAKEKSDKIQADLAKANKERNEAYKKRVAQEELQKQNIMAEGKQSEIKAVEAERKRQKDVYEQLKGYSSAVTQDNYDDYLAYAKEQGVEFPGAASPDEVMRMEPSAFKSYMGGFFGGGGSKTGKPPSVKEQVMGKYIAGDEMTEREQEYVNKQLRVAPPGGKQIVQTDQGYMIVDKNNPDYQEKLNINKPMTATQQDTVEKIKTLQDTIGQIKTLYKKDYVGMVQGRKGAMATAIGIGTDAQEQMFRAKTAELMKMVYALSGKQINQQEMERLRPFIPEVNDSDIAFETKVKAFKNQLDDVLANKLEVFVGETKSGGQVTPLPLAPASVIDARGDELEASGLTPAQVVVQLRAEGLLK